MQRARNQDEEERALRRKQEEERQKLRQKQLEEQRLKEEDQRKTLEALQLRRQEFIQKTKDMLFIPQVQADEKSKKRVSQAILRGVPIGFA